VIDDLTKLPNLPGLLDRANSLPEWNIIRPLSLLAIQITDLWQVIRDQGRPAGMIY
jgi:hypothetical protein